MKQVEKTIYVEQAGTLKNLISEDEKMNVTHLKISGFLNDKDFDVLDDMCSCYGEFDDDDNFIPYPDEPPFLTVLDLGDCILTDKSILGEFTYYSRLEKFICPKNLKATCDLGVFENSLLLKTVVLPSTFKEFGYLTFMHCESLEDINFPEDLEGIGSFSFSNCTALNTVKIPAKVSFIGSAAFGGCNKLEKFEIDAVNPHYTVVDGVLFNKDKTQLVAFPCGYKNKHYSVPEGVKVIGDGSFFGSQIETVDFPSSLQIIEGWAFRFCSNLKTIDIPDSVTDIGELAFEFCTSLEKVKLPNKLSILKNQTFGGGYKLKEIDIPSSVKIIENTALGWSRSLETIHLHDGLEVLNDFTNCSTLKNVIIPKTVKEIASGIFRHSIFISEIKLDKDNPYFCIIDGALCSKDGTKLIAVPGKERKEFVIPDGVTEIEEFVFEGFEQLETLYFPQSLHTLGHRAFEGCKSLKKISLPKSLGAIDFRCFDDCVNLETIEILALNPPEITKPSASCWKFFGDAKDAILYVPQDSLKVYKKAFGWKNIRRIKKIS